MQSVGSDGTDKDFCKKFLQNFCKNNKTPYVPYIGYSDPNSSCIVIGSIYNVVLNNENMPRYSYFIMFGFDKLIHFGTVDFTFVYNTLI